MATLRALGFASCCPLLAVIIVALFFLMNAPLVFFGPLLFWYFRRG
jgi:hypothetical protein